MVNRRKPFQKPQPTQQTNQKPQMNYEENREREMIESELLEAGWKHVDKATHSPQDITQTGWYATINKISNDETSSISYEADIWMGKSWCFYAAEGQVNYVVKERLMIKGPYNNKEGAQFCFPDHSF